MMGDSDLKTDNQEQVQVQQVNLVNLENRVARVEKLLRILDSELNNKIRWIIKTAGIGESQNAGDEGDEDDDEFQQPESKPLPRILQRQFARARAPQVRRQPASAPSVTVTYKPPRPQARFIAPAVQYDDEEDEDAEDNGQQQDSMDNDNGNETSGTMWSTGDGMEVDENGEGDSDDDRTAGADDYYDDDEGLDPLSLQVELIEPDDAPQNEGDDEENTTGNQNESQNDDGNNPWRFGEEGQEQDDEEEQGDPDQEQDEDEDLDQQEALHLPIPAHFMDVSQLRSSDTSMTRRPQPGSILKSHIRRPILNNLRLIQAQGRNKSNNQSRRIIVPKNRYLMSSSLVSRLQEQNILTTSGTELKLLPSKSATSTGSSAKEKVYFCDRCPMTFTLSTRHAHLELHKQMDLGKGQNTNTKVVIKKKAKSSPKSLLKPISSLSPVRKPRIRPRKICPICTKSYSRNQYLRNHMEEHVAEFPFLCKECFTVHNSEKELEDHCQSSDRCFISMYQP